MVLHLQRLQTMLVATVLTVYGIETREVINRWGKELAALQQYLPFTVLKLRNVIVPIKKSRLQQYLPFTVLKRQPYHRNDILVLYELQQYLPFTVLKRFSEVFNATISIKDCCNSTYRLRY